MERDTKSINNYIWKPEGMRPLGIYEQQKACEMYQWSSTSKPAAGHNTSNNINQFDSKIAQYNGINSDQ
jgi:hypothetical protein